MLQQTQVDTVIPRFLTFLERFPTLAALGQARVEEVIEAWAGLGYYRRARSLHQGARYVVENHGGRVPASLEALLALPGVGRYTAGAIGSIAFGLPLPIVDGNVARVAARLFCVAQAMDTPEGSRALWRHAEALVCQHNPGALNQALMELGALVCRPRDPKCLICPVREFCQAYKTGRVADFPKKKATLEVSELPMAMLWVESPQGVLLVRRPLEGRWAGLWEMPTSEGVGAKRKLEHSLKIRLTSPVARIKHRLTHRAITMDIYAVSERVAKRLPQTMSRQEFKLSQAPENEPISGLARKALSAIRQASTFREKYAKAR